jgi:hypothetical protein
VVRLLRAAGVAGAPPAALVAGVGFGGSLYWPRPWLWDPDWWHSSIHAGYSRRYDEVLLRALPVGPLDAGARVEGFAYFPRLRPDARRVTLEFHHRLGETPHVLTLPFAVERATGPRPSG